MVNGRRLCRDGNPDGMWRLQTCRYDVRSRTWVCTGQPLLHMCTLELLNVDTFWCMLNVLTSWRRRRNQTKVWFCVRQQKTLGDAAKMLQSNGFVGEFIVSMYACDIIFQHVLPCSDHNLAATGSRAGLWVEELGFVTSLPGRSWSNPSRRLQVDSSIQLWLLLLMLSPGERKRQDTCIQWFWGEKDDNLKRAFLEKFKTCPKTSKT